MQQFKALIKQQRWVKILLLSLLIIVVTACSSQEKTENSVGVVLTMTSTAFQSGDNLDSRFAKNKENLSIPLTWSTTPNGTQSFAIFMVDIHPVANNWAHWVVVDIPANVQSLEEGASGTDAMPAGSRELYNSFGAKGYGGPQPPAGSGNHEYKTIIYALDVKTLELPNERIMYTDFIKLVEPHIVEQTEISGFYENK